MERIERHIVVAGGGVIGLAITRELALRGLDVAAVEAEPKIGMGISSRNSEVIHAGLYYPHESLKTHFCITGNAMLYDYATQRGVEHRKCGKLVVATETQLSELEKLKQHAEANGVSGIRWLSSAEAKRMEEQVLCAAALYVPHSGMINSHELMLHLQTEALEARADITISTRIVGGDVNRTQKLIEMETETQKGKIEKFEVACDIFINAAGLEAQQLSGILGLPSATIPRQILGKGNYFKLKENYAQRTGRPAPFERLIYPLPGPNSSGLHARRDFDGQIIFGPSLEIVDRLDYNVNMACLSEFQNAIQSYWRDAGLFTLEPAYAGIRPKLKVSPGIFPDFNVQGPRQHGVDGVFALYGIESPGLTCCLSLARALADQIAPQGAGGRTKRSTLPNSPDLNYTPRSSRVGAPCPEVPVRSKVTRNSAPTLELR